jgi:hypothetical protein
LLLPYWTGKRFTSFIKPKAFYWRGAISTCKLSWTVPYPSGLKTASLPEWIIGTSVLYQRLVGGATGSSTFAEVLLGLFLCSLELPRCFQGLAHSPVCRFLALHLASSPNREKKKKKRGVWGGEWEKLVANDAAKQQCSLPMHLGLFCSLKGLFKDCSLYLWSAYILVTYYLMD